MDCARSSWSKSVCVVELAFNIDANISQREPETIIIILFIKKEIAFLIFVASESRKHRLKRLNGKY